MYIKKLKRCYKRKAANFLAVFFISSLIATSASGSVSHASSKETAVTSVHTDFTTPEKQKLTTQKAEPVTLSQKKDTILVDTTASLSVNNLTKRHTVEFESSDESILKIVKKTDSSCEYRGIQAGTADITVKISRPGFLFVPNNTYLYCKVTVSPKAVSIRFTKSKYTMKPGKKKKLTLTTRPSISKEKAKFESSNPDVAEVASDGVVYAKSNGTAYITAKISNGKTSKCKIMVKSKPAAPKKD